MPFTVAFSQFSRHLAIFAVVHEKMARQIKSFLRQGILGVALFTILVTSSVNAKADDEDEGKKEKETTSNGTFLEFVLTAMDLPVKRGILGQHGPDTFVEMGYFEKKGDENTKNYETAIVIKNAYPEYPNVMQVTFNKGQGQRIKFTVKEKGGNSIGHCSTSVKNIVNAANNELKLDLIGTDQKPGHLLIATLINNDVGDDTDERLARKRKQSLVVNLDKKPKKSKDKKRKNPEEEPEEDE